MKSMLQNENIFVAVKRGDIKLVEEMLSENSELLNEKAPDTWSLLQCAIYHGQPEIALWLIQKGIYLSSINRDNQTALRLARQKNMKNVRDALLTNGATK